MSLAVQFANQLQAHVGQTHVRIEVADGQRTLRCDVDRCDLLAAAIYGLVLETPELAATPLDRLQEASRALAGRVNYLMEPIAPLEFDAAGCVVQMRSVPPRQEEEQGRAYYEVLLNRGGSLALYRYEKFPGAPRSRIPAALTHEVLRRVVDDFTATLDALA